MIIRKGQQVCTAADRPIFRPEQPHQAVNDLKHIAGIESGMDSLIALVIGQRMQMHLIQHPAVLSMQYLSQ